MKPRWRPLPAVALLLAACSVFAPSGPPFLAYFPERSSPLDAKARDVVPLAAQRANEVPAARVKVVG